jgi:hypothetical protein
MLAAGQCAGPTLGARIAVDVMFSSQAEIPPKASSQAYKHRQFLSAAQPSGQPVPSKEVKENTQTTQLYSCQNTLPSLKTARFSHPSLQLKGREQVNEGESATQPCSLRKRNLSTLASALGAAREPLKPMGPQTIAGTRTGRRNSIVLDTYHICLARLIFKSSCTSFKSDGQSQVSFLLELSFALTLSISTISQTF